jgi:hypothetical protein
MATRSGSPSPAASDRSTTANARTLTAHEVTELEAIERRGCRWAPAANISVAATATATATIVLIIAAASGSYAPVVTANSDTLGLAVASGF